MCHDPRGPHCVVRVKFVDHSTCLTPPSKIRELWERRDVFIRDRRDLPNATSITPSGLRCNYITVLLHCCNYTMIKLGRLLKE